MHDLTRFNKVSSNNIYSRLIMAIIIIIMYDLTGFNKVGSKNKDDLAHYISILEGCTYDLTRLMAFKVSSKSKFFPA